MRNSLKKLIEIRITGRNIERIIKRIMRNNISLLKIKKINKDCIHVLIYSKDLEKIEKIKTIYEIEVIKNYGLLKIKELIIKNKLLIFFMIVGYALLILLSNTIFSVEVIHTDKNLRELLLNELSLHGVKKYELKKTYKELVKIKNTILDTYKDTIEWLEIEELGTKYIVRVEERILNKEEKEESYQDIVAKKSAIIMEINAEGGQIVKNKLDYVKAGDTIISGYITLNDNIKDTVSAKGTVYGEVWYKVSIEYPLHYEEVIETKNKKKVLAFHFLNKTYELFNFNKYKERKINSKILLKSNLLPISFTLDEQQEINVIDETYTKEQAVNKAKDKIRDKIESRLSKDEYIIEIKQLKVEENNSTIILDAFVTVYEDITATKIIPEYVQEEKESE